MAQLSEGIDNYNPWTLTSSVSSLLLVGGGYETTTNRLKVSGRAVNSLRHQHKPHLANIPRWPAYQIKQALLHVHPGYLYSRHPEL